MGRRRRLLLQPTGSETPMLCDIQADGGNFFRGRLPFKRWLNTTTLAHRCGRGAPPHHPKQTLTRYGWTNRLRIDRDDPERTGRRTSVVLANVVKPDLAVTDH